MFLKECLKECKVFGNAFQTQYTRLDLAISIYFDADKASAFLISYCSYEKLLEAMEKYGRRGKPPDFSKATYGIENSV